MPSLFEETLLIGSYEGIFFPIVEAATEGGHDNVKHKAYKRRGADCEPTGLKEYSGTLKLALVNGLQTWEQLFPDIYHDLLNKIESTPIGRLQHPTKGAFTALVETWSEQLSGKGPHNGVMLDLHWVEHNGEATVLPLLDGQSATSNTTNAATIQATEADVAVATASGSSPYQGMSATVNVQLTYLDAQTRSYTEVVQAIGAILVLVEANLALPALAVASAHPAVVALERLRATTYRLRDKYLGTNSQPRTYVVPRTAPLWMIAHEVYGDSSKAQLLATVNSMIDPTEIPAGRQLLIPMV